MLTSSDSNADSNEDPNKEKAADKATDNPNVSTPETAPTTGGEYAVGGVADAAVGLPQTGNVRIQKSSLLGAGLVAVTLTAMGTTKLRKK